ncbi:MAG: DUF4178 domain-containing protein [Chloroflexi bacterium]|nr:DUF4178 domain-containing protein [Chloroflexota bacterium]
MVFERLFGRARQPEPERTVTTLQVGDAVTLSEDDFTVEQCHELHGDGGDVWWKYLLQNPQRRVWLDVDEDQGLTITAYEPLHTHVAVPVPATITLDGKTYKVDEHGFANDIVTKRSGQSGERVEYWYLSADGGEQVVVWRLGDNPETGDQALQTGTVEVGIGREIQPFQLTIYQGEG